MICFYIFIYKIGICTVSEMNLHLPLCCYFFMEGESRCGNRCWFLQKNYPEMPIRNQSCNPSGVFPDALRGQRWISSAEWPVVLRYHHWTTWTTWPDALRGQRGITETEWPVTLSYHLWTALTEWPDALWGLRWIAETVTSCPEGPMLDPINTMFRCPAGTTRDYINRVSSCPEGPTLDHLTAWPDALRGRRWNTLTTTLTRGSLGLTLEVVAENLRVALGFLCFSYSLFQRWRGLFYLRGSSVVGSTTSTLRLCAHLPAPYCTAMIHWWWLPLPWFKIHSI